MNFKNWLKNEGNQELAKTYKNMLYDVPQDPNHHFEGSAAQHSQLVRKAIPKAISELKSLQTNDPRFSDILSNVNFDLDQNEYQILLLAAWLHDIGKSSSTTINGEDFRKAKLNPKVSNWLDDIKNKKIPYGEKPKFKIQSIGHDKPEHYLPAIEKLMAVAPPQILNLYLSNQDLIHFLIDHHMDFTASNVGFSKRFVAEHFENGKVKNTKEMRLLLILMWADKMGRKPTDKILNSLNKNAEYLSLSAKRNLENSQKPQNKPYFGSPEEMNQMLKSKFLDKNQRFIAIKRKFPELSDEEIISIVNI